MCCNKKKLETWFGIITKLIEIITYGVNTTREQYQNIITDLLHSHKCMHIGSALVKSLVDTLSLPSNMGL